MSLNAKQTQLRARQIKLDRDKLLNLRWQATQSRTKAWGQFYGMLGMPDLDIMLVRRYMYKWEHWDDRVRDFDKQLSNYDTTRDLARAVVLVRDPSCKRVERKEQQNEGV